MIIAQPWWSYREISALLRQESVITGGYIRLSADCPHPPIFFQDSLICAQ